MLLTTLTALLLDDVEKVANVPGCTLGILVLHALASIRVIFVVFGPASALLSVLERVERLFKQVVLLVAVDLLADALHLRARIVSHLTSRVIATVLR